MTKEEFLSEVYKVLKKEYFPKVTYSDTDGFHRLEYLGTRIEYDGSRKLKPWHLYVHGNSYASDKLVYAYEYFIQHMGDVLRLAAARKSND